MDPKGNLYIADTSNHQIQKYSQDGHLITRWGTAGSNPGQFNLPKGLALDERGNVYVADTDNHRIQKFTANGKYLDQWGAQGQGNGEFNQPKGIAVDDSSGVYVVDTQNHRIQRFSKDGAYLGKWGREDCQAGIADGELNAPEGIALEGKGHAYVADTLNHRIQKFTTDGGFVAAWGKEDGQRGSGNGEFYCPEGVALDSSGQVYVADTFNHRIQKFSSDGAFLTKWGRTDCQPGSGEMQFNYPRGILFDKNDNAFIADSWNCRIKKHSADGRFITQWGSQGSDEGRFTWPKGVAVDAGGYVYVSDAMNHRIQQFGPNGRFVRKWGRWGTGEREFKQPMGMATDTGGNLYVADWENHRVQKFDKDGTFLLQLGTGQSGSGKGRFNFPEGVATNLKGQVYVADTWNRRIQKFSSDGRHLLTWSAKHVDDKEEAVPTGIAVDKSGNVYVVDRANLSIKKFTANGGFLGKWRGDFTFPNGLSIDADSNLYVADTYNHRIQKLTQDGQLIAQFGGFGSDPGQLNCPFAVAAGADGVLYVAEFANNRVQAFREISLASNNKAIIVAGGGPCPGNALWESTALTANFAYRALAYQGFTKESIFYLSADTGLDLDGNGKPDDVDAKATNANLKKALTDWAKGAENVILYLVDHGGVGEFIMRYDGESLSAHTLASWLDSLETSIRGKVIVIYEGCHSGSFLPALAASASKRRMVLSSAQDDEKAIFLNNGSISFSNFFWTQVFNGLDILSSFKLARSAIGYAAKYQHPLLDASSNGKGNESGDFAAAQGVYVGNGTDSLNKAPTIEAVSPDQLLTTGSRATLVARGVADKDGIARVWSVIRPPDFVPGPVGNPIADLPSVDLKCSKSGTCEGSYGSFNLPGTYHIAIYATDRIGNTSVPKQTTVSVRSPRTRKAIIVAGGSPSDRRWTAVSKNAASAYQSLTFQGYRDEDIVFMSPESSSPGVDQAPTLDNLQHAIEVWAHQNTQDLVVYLVGHGEWESFRLSDTEALLASDLGQWLNQLQAQISARVIVVYDASSSGSFIPSLAPPQSKERIVITSTDRSQSAYFGSEGDISFSRYFWNEILNGRNVREAFLETISALRFFHEEQTPLMDDDGDGIGNEKTDGKLARASGIGLGILLAGGPPVIGKIAPRQVLHGETSARIWVKGVTGTNTMEKVWAVIREPGQQPALAGGSASASAAYTEKDLPTLVLKKIGSDRFEGVYKAFTRTGSYEIAVYAMDKSGSVSLPKTTTIRQTTTTQCPVNTGFRKGACQ